MAKSGMLAKELLVGWLSPTIATRELARVRLESNDDWDAFSTELTRMNRIDVVLLAAVNAVSKQQDPTATDLAAVLCKVIAAPAGADATLTGMRAEVTTTLRFFNEADTSTLSNLTDSSTSLALVGARPEGGYTRLEQILAVDGVRVGLIEPAALSMHSDWTDIRDSKEASE